ncbi:MAG: hypothetical protein COW30_16080 [Rhodospirillales bacterium CG15_BIG_FIL_POST_REV_8_21_14_020_66_15]|nr:MAG: hypothetical protein COW30_16080 [Rhodospirillales bacterium CG15_BIG_FIL_POST_REV_8_21_14_020_66_15]
MPGRRKSALKPRGRRQARSGPGIAGLTDDLIDAYRASRITQAEIAEQLGVGREAVRRALKARGVVQTKSKNFQDRRGSCAPEGPANGPAAEPASDPAGGPATADAAALLAEADAAFLDLLRLSNEEIEAEGRRLKEYAKALHASWRQVQAYVLDVFVAEQQGRAPKMSPKVIGQVVRILQALGPNPIQHWREVVLPQQEAMAQEHELPTLRVEAMTPEDVAAIMRRHAEAGTTAS